MKKADVLGSMVQERPFAFIGIGYSDGVYPHVKTPCGRELCAVNREILRDSRRFLEVCASGSAKS
jgi:hypothetical protein